jgi:Lar family restriction alleviation protein
MTELKNCPFCGSNNLHLTHNGMQNWVIGCGVCQVEMENFVDREQAIKAWNTRTPPVPCAICNRPEQDHSPVDSCCKGFAKDLADNQNSSG